MCYSSSLEVHEKLIGAYIVKNFNVDYNITLRDSIDFRRHVFALREKQRLTTRETAKWFHMASAPVTRWVKQIEPKPATSRRRKIDKSALAKEVEHYPDAYQRVRGSVSGSARRPFVMLLKALRLTRKKTCIIPKPTKTHKKGFNTKFSPINQQGKRLFISPKGVFLMIPLAHTAIPR